MEILLKSCEKQGKQGGKPLQTLTLRETVIYNIKIGRETSVRNEGTLRAFAPEKDMSFSVAALLRSNKET